MFKISMQVYIIINWYHVFYIDKNKIDLKYFEKTLRIRD